ncbi:hypothetical protein E2C01_041011 [Portunus trituberculatus]|uniref:Uncharacterized protein n=1 Tax=Portunus trituberculatus TaxID=210409 RepID=A0A5B7FPS7_PORTR|nr:hypothetical protein [Portunus trituberculatus]
MAFINTLVIVVTYHWRFVPPVLLVLLKRCYKQIMPSVAAPQRKPRMRRTPKLRSQNSHQKAHNTKEALES